MLRNLKASFLFFFIKNSFFAVAISNMVKTRLMIMKYILEEVGILKFTIWFQTNLVSESLGGGGACGAIIHPRVYALSHNAANIALS